MFKCHDYFNDACNGRNGKEDEYVVPRAIIRRVVFDEDQGRSSQLHEHMYAQYHEVEYRCQIREIHALCLVNYLPFILIVSIVGSNIVVD